MSDVEDAPPAAAAAAAAVADEAPQTKRKMSEAQLKNLEQARVKARAKKLELGDLRSREAAVKKKILDDRIEALRVAEAAAAKKKKTKYKVVESSSSSESSSEEDDEAPPPPRRRRKKPPPPQQQSIETAETTALANTLVRDELEARLSKQLRYEAFGCLFPGKQNIYA